MKTYDAEWFQTALNATRDLVLIKGPRSQLLWANRAFREYYGMSDAQLRDIIDAEHSDPEDTLQYVIDDQKVFDSARDLDIPREVVTDADGVARDFHTVKSPILRDGRVARSIGISRLIEDKAVFSRDVDHIDAKSFVAPLQSLTRGFPLPMVLVDVAKRVVNASPIWAESFGGVKCSKNAFFHDCYPALSEISSAIETCLRTRKPTQKLITYESQDAGPQKFLFQTSPWTFEDDTLGGVTIVGTDVSEFHQQSESLQRANDELMQFSYRASHDLKGPLSTVKGLAGFIAEDIESGQLDEARHNATRIKVMMERLEETVISILALSQAELHDEDHQLVALPTLLDETCQGLGLQISESNVDIQADFQVSHLSCQPTRLRQIVENLVSNGIKYRASRDEPSFVKISSRHVDGGTALRIRDNGMGVPQVAHEEIFELFSRLHVDGGGSGLGLAIVRKHIDALRGAVSVENLPDGTAFNVFIPERKIEVAA